ncbi:hypothetical protein AC578_4042 [Pseudocercospora eumusae]|uniref:Uncharacterized protein n=1 Tax=Pseudocercospora eumusae TaxID=321146 RepID=A0A139HDW8_9PEZI|nr:hypothetical protein AC578_4042 [Pseudocercospora eumusae]
MLMAGGDSNEDTDTICMIFSATLLGCTREHHLRFPSVCAGQVHKKITQELIYVNQDREQQAVYDSLFA